ncbi:MAG: ribokinase [Weeksellaceae bacterium]|nr:ribokinase [Weeksellaceae bacterium]
MKLSSEQPKIIVVGSSSIDLVLLTARHPQPNETVMASKADRFFGGKGANQAVGTARLGAIVYFVGCVGMDPLGKQVIGNLVNEGVNVGFIHETERADTGTAYVTSAGGKNAIVVVPAANYCLKPEHINRAEKYFESADLILLQLEIPMDTVEHTVQLAKRYGKKVLIYAAPAMKLSEEVLEYASFIVAKSSELSLIFGEANREHVLRNFPNKVFVRDDTNSTTYFNGSEMKYYRNDHDDMLYKIGMGDAFTSGFAVAYCHGNPIEVCVKFGTDVSLKVAKNKGSQGGLPYLADLVL